jgi:hypothetical protein
MRHGFMEPRGPMPIHYDNQRSYHRHYLRGKALLKQGTTLLGIYAKDVSRKGIGFLSPMQLLPLEQVQMKLPDGTQLNLQITRCHRIEAECYECGAKFIL